MIEWPGPQSNLYEMAESPKPWSTPKFLLLALIVTFGVFFLGNGICNEILELGVPSYLFGGIASLALLPMMWRWRVFRGAVGDANKNDR